MLRIDICIYESILKVKYDFEINTQLIFIESYSNMLNIHNFVGIPTFGRCLVLFTSQQIPTPDTR